MSDYLWDKTGEPDAETERLENLLGQLRFQPTPFDLPAELPARDFRATRVRNILSWPRLAVAASLTLAVLAGAWLMLRQQAGKTNDAAQVAEQNNRANVGENSSTAAVAPKATEGPTGNDAGGEKRDHETPAVAPPKGSESRRGKLGAGGQRPRLPDLDAPGRTQRAVASPANRTETARATKRQRNLATPHNETPLREETAALTVEEREAAEKVLYALRITSEKLNYARRQVQGPARAEENR